ncbi:Uncharacterised protein [uncultured archaeon]|nr:Uncharacterised protein [uncultured archaeon]
MKVDIGQLGCFGLTPRTKELYAVSDKTLSS